MATDSTRGDGRTPSQIRCATLLDQPWLQMTLHDISMRLPRPGDGSTNRPSLAPFLRRRLHCETGVLSRADGSAQWTQEGSSVLAAVYGPLETTAAKESAEQASVEVVYKPRAGLAGTAEQLKQRAGVAGSAG